MAYRKTVRHFHEVGHLHELTFSCFHRLPLLTNDFWREKLARCIDAADEETGIELVGFVFMPEHLHLLVFPTVPTPSISRYLARIKNPFSKQIKEMLAEQRSPLLTKLTVREKSGKEYFQFWQAGPGYDRNLFSADALASSLDYIHNNPVRRELCRQATDWKWSSARYYHNVPPQQQYPGLPRVHDLPEGSLR